MTRRSKDALAAARSEDRALDREIKASPADKPGEHVGNSSLAAQTVEDQRRADCNGLRREALHGRAKFTRGVQLLVELPRRWKHTPDQATVDPLIFLRDLA